jgi:hypothetical protein
MKFKLLICAFLVLAIPAAVFVEATQAQDPGLKNSVILIIRHAEDADTGSGLSSLGAVRARAYADYFKHFTIDGQPLKLDYIFAAMDSRNSHRSRVTIEPTAEEFGLAVDSHFKNKQFMELVDAIKTAPRGANILISWHHGKIPQLLQALGADPNKLLPNGKWPDDVFGWLIQLRYDDNGRLFESKRLNAFSSLSVIQPQQNFLLRSVSHR